MDWTIAYYVIAGIVILAGLAGTILPALPGVPLVFAGMFIAAWAGHFQTIGTWTLVLLGLLAAIAMALDFLASVLGARHVGASKAALWGALLGTLVGIFFGVPGLLFGPFLGALAGELLAGSSVVRSTKVGLATWIGLLFGTLAKLALSFTMLGVFVLALVIP